MYKVYLRYVFSKKLEKYNNVGLFPQPYVSETVVQAGDVYGPTCVCALVARYHQSVAELVEMVLAEMELGEMVESVEMELAEMV